MVVSGEKNDIVINKEGGSPENRHNEAGGKTARLQLWSILLRRIKRPAWVLPGHGACESISRFVSAVGR